MKPRCLHIFMSTSSHHVKIEQGLTSTHDHDDDKAALYAGLMHTRDSALNMYGMNAGPSDQLSSRLATFYMWLVSNGLADGTRALTTSLPLPQR